MKLSPSLSVPLEPLESIGRSTRVHTESHTHTYTRASLSQVTVFTPDKHVESRTETMDSTRSSAQQNKHDQIQSRSD